MVVHTWSCFRAVRFFNLVPPHIHYMCVPTASGLAVMDEVDLAPSVVWTGLGSTERKIVGSEEWSIFCQETLVLMGILADT